MAAEASLLDSYDAAFAQEENNTLTTVNLVRCRCINAADVSISIAI